MSKNKWNVEEFVDYLNINLPLNNQKNIDSRKSDNWNVRLLRHYTTSNVLNKPIKIGRRSYYNETHFEELKKFFDSQSLGLSLRSYITISKTSEPEDSKVEMNSIENRKKEILSLIDNKDVFLKGTEKILNKENILKANTLNISNNKEFMWKKLEINEYLTIFLREDQIDKKEEIINKLNKI